jgi:hypothetical protein
MGKAFFLFQNLILGIKKPGPAKTAPGQGYGNSLTALPP